MIVWSDGGEPVRSAMEAAIDAAIDTAIDTAIDPALAGATEPAKATLQPDDTVDVDAAWAWERVGSARVDGGATVCRWRTASGTDAAWPGTLIVVDDAPASQFGALQQAWADGERVPDLLACLALTGSRFRGQRGRTWSALRGNLHLTVHHAVDLPAAPAQVPLVVAPVVALARAVERLSAAVHRVRPRVKWVNDLLLDLGGPDGLPVDHKVAGVLSATRTEGDRVRGVLYGIGANVAQVPPVPPSPRALPPARLADADPTFAGGDAWARLALAVLHELRVALACVADGRGEALVDEYRERAAFLGRTVTIWPVGSNDDDEVEPIAHGRCVALGSDLSLTLEGSDTCIRTGRMTLDPHTLD